MKITLYLLTLFLTITSVDSKNFDFKYEKDLQKQSEIITKIANQLLIQYGKDDFPINYDDKFRIEIAAKHYQDAIDSLNKLRVENNYSFWVGLHYEIYSKALIHTNKTHTDFASNYNKILNKIYPKVEPEFQNSVIGGFTQNPQDFKKKIADYTFSIKDKKTISLNEAIDLSRLFASLQTFKKIHPLSKIYFKDKFVDYDKEIFFITTRDGAQLSALLIRPKNTYKVLPTIFVFNIYAGEIDEKIAKNAARNGYIGLVVNTRGKRNSPQDINPSEYDAKDAYDIIDWISKQPWSDGKVGMYGGSYLGFSQWAAVKYFHPALKTIIPQVAVAKGIDFPMFNNVFVSYMLQWIHLVENNKMIDNTEFDNKAKWKNLAKEWYEKGLSFRSLDNLEGRPNKTFQRWLDHPSYDSYWQNMTPYKHEFSNINIPILTITGYFDADQRGALYYFNQHYKYNKNANHYLLIGPYDHFGAQGAITNSVNGYTIDSVAKIDIDKLVYQWFDYALKGEKKPDLIKDRVNYEVMGSNIWKHAASLDDMHNDEIKFYFDNKLSSKEYSLSKEKPKNINFIEQEIDFKDRSDFNSFIINSFDQVINSAYSKNNGIAYISKPFVSEFELNGSFSSQINLEINKKDLDISMILYEVMPNNKYFLLSAYLGRASYTKNKSKRKLLTPNKKEQISFNNTFLTSTLIAKGSRLLVVISVNKNPYYQLNYGTGKDVSDETIKDAETPLRIKWFNDSFIRIPIKR